jgi:hypothetical protein
MLLLPMFFFLVASDHLLIKLLLLQLKFHL